MTEDESSSSSPPLRHQALVIHDESQTADIAQWLTGLVAQKLPQFNIRCVTEKEEVFFERTMKELSSTPDAERGSMPPTMLLVVFYDGQSDASKAIFLKFRTWAAAQQPNVLLQALNSKKGTHSLLSNADAVMSTIMKKLPPAAGGPTPAATATTTTSSAAATATASTSTSASPAAASRPKHQDPTATPSSTTASTSTTPSAAAAAAAKPAAALPEDNAPSTFTYELTDDRIQEAVAQGQGETYWTISEPVGEFDDAVKKLTALCKGHTLGMTPLCAPRDLTEDDGVAIRAQEFILRRDVEETHIEMRVAMCGNVDSGKSTLTSVLTRGFMDDGRGLARSKVFVHKHEADTGRTSSISENHLGYDAHGNVVNYPAGGPGSHQKHGISAQEMASRSSKIVTLYDLAGHEKYLKTTVLGMTRSMPDFACIVISANNGIQRMTKEHLGLCLALKLPFFIVVTRIDATPDNVRQQTNSSILKLLRMPTVKKLAYPIKKDEDVIVCAKNLKADRICPIFEVSNVTGQGIPFLTNFINLLPVRKDWNSALKQPREMIIDSTFFVTGVGTVVGGIITQGTFKVNDSVLLGPDGLGKYRTTQIKSIHVKGVDVPSVDAGNDAALCLKKEKRSAIRKGMVLVEPSTQPKSYWQFEAEIVILYHSTTISSDYEPVIHSQTVRQSARILLVNQEVLRTGDRAIVRFQFLYRPEFMKLGHRLVFREGRTKGIGAVTKLIECPEGADGNADVSQLGVTDRSKMKAVVRQKHVKPSDGKH